MGEITQQIAAIETCEFTFIQPIQTLWEDTNTLDSLEIIWQQSSFWGSGAVSGRRIHPKGLM